MKKLTDIIESLESKQRSMDRGYVAYIRDEIEALNSINTEVDKLIFSLSKLRDCCNCEHEYTCNGTKCEYREYELKI